jgi:hypothetical protein
MLLIQTAAQIRLCTGITLPTDNEIDLREGQAHLLLQAARVDMTQHDHNAKYVTKEKVGTLEVDYEAGKSGDVTQFPPMAKLFLGQYGCSGGGGSFSQSTTSKA